MNNLKKLLALLLAMVMVVGMIPFGVMAEESDPTETTSVVETTAPVETTVPTETTMPQTQPTEGKTVCGICEGEHKTEDCTVCAFCKVDPCTCVICEECGVKNDHTSTCSKVQKPETCTECGKEVCECEAEETTEATTVPTETTEETTAPTETEEEEVEEEDNGPINAGPTGDEEEENIYDRPVGFTKAGPLLEFLPPMMRTFALRAASVDDEDIYTSKSLEYLGGEDYKLRLEAYLEGDPSTAKRTPSNIVLVVDQSGSMDDCFGCGDDHADDAFLRYSTLKLDGSEKYYVKAKSDSTKGTRVYYCSGEGCTLAHAKSGSHTGGWFTKNHATATTSGTQYIPSPADGTITNTGTNYNKVSGRIFYTDSAMTTKAAVSTRFHADGIYYNSTKTTQYVFCKLHGYWHTSNSNMSSSSCTNTSVRIPYANSNDSTGFYTVKFYAARMAHAVATKDIKTNQTYWIATKKLDGTDGYGDTYKEVKYCSLCSSGTSYKYFHLTTATHTSSSSTVPTKYRSTSTRIFYSPCKVACGSRYDALIESLNAFKEQIYNDKDANGNAVKNRIAVVGFGNRDADDTEAGTYASNILLTYYINGTETPAKDRKPFIPYATANKNTTNIKKYFGAALRNATTTTGQKYIDYAVSSLIDSGGNTQTYKGLYMAKQIFTYTPEEYENNKKVVILFTDGEPTDGPSDDAFGGANYALKHADALKDMGATVFTVGVFSGANASNQAVVNKATSTGNLNVDDETNKFMHLVSSNFGGELNAKDMAPKYSQADAKTGYYLSAGNKEELKASFLSIAQSITGGGANQQLNANTVVRDIIADGFELNGDAKNVTVYTQDCTKAAVDKNGNATYTFSTDKALAGDDKTNITVTKTADGDVEVKGFSFKDEYVAYTKETDNSLTPRGRKLVIEIPVKKTADNPGGQGMVTNDSASGIYVGTKVYENFSQPMADIPTTVNLSKEVVGKNASANQEFDFNISYSKFTGNVNTAYKDNTPSNGNYLEAEPVSGTATATLGHGESVTGGIKNVLVGSEMTITEKAPADYMVEYTTDGGQTWNKAKKDGSDWKIVIDYVEAGMNVQVRNTLQKADLTITKNLSGVRETEQSFLFHVYRLPDTVVDDGSGDDDNNESEETPDVETETPEDEGSGNIGGNTGGSNEPGNEDVEVEAVPDDATFIMDIVISAESINAGFNSVTIKDIPVGNYLVVEDDNWSWRYEVTSDSSKFQYTAVTPENGGQVEFTNSKENNWWLSGDCYAENWWNGTSITKR